MSRKDDELTRLADNLPLAIEPPEDLWPLIEAGLGSQVTQADQQNQRPVPHWRVPFGLAAATVLVATAGFWLGAQNGSGPPATEVALQKPPADVTPVSYQTEPDLHAVRLALAETIYEQLNTLPPETQAVVNENLQTISESLDRIDAALAQAPATTLDRRLLMAMYADQLDLLNSMNGLIRRSSQETVL